MNVTKLGCFFAWKNTEYNSQNKIVLHLWRITVFQMKRALFIIMHTYIITSIHSSNCLYHLKFCKIYFSKLYLNFLYLTKCLICCSYIKCFLLPIWQSLYLYNLAWSEYCKNKYLNKHMPKLLIKSLS